MKSIAIIPARSGSKGVADKNIRLLKGKPLMAYTIEAAVRSGLFNEVMVSTESAEYAQIAKAYKAQVPFLRSMENSLDHSDSWDVVAEVLGLYKEMGREFDNFCLLQPTSPLRNAEDIRQAYAWFYEKKAGAVVSVCECEHSPLWCNTLEKNLELNGFIKPKDDLPRQDLKKFYRVNGAIYIFDTKAFEANRFIYREGSYAYIMPAERSVDIDNLIDFKVAEVLLEEYE
ncbi:MAG TPA: CMP-N-acetlyneuraminic acid synthetase [Lachnospiraceae bacterium]|nr:CMP-N-acetlyneuraminic acid synthetase [Lachnospiraceae bacterium]